VWLKEKIGIKEYSALIEKRNQIVKITKKDEKLIAAHYRKEYKRMVKDGTFDFKNWEGI